MTTAKTRGSAAARSRHTRAPRARPSHDHDEAPLATNGASAAAGGTGDADKAPSAEAAPADAPAAMRRPTVSDVWHAQEIIRQHVYHTPLLPSRTFSDMTGAKIYLKAENLQRSGAYKIRGATNKLAHLTPEERACGVIAASAGNHAQGVALAASALDVRCTIVMPLGAPLAKVTATRGYGAEVILYGDTYNDAYEHARALQRERGMSYIHAFDDPDIIAGQGTLGLEMLADLPEVEVVVVSIGGGGLISGIATAVKALKPDVRIVGVQASGAASMRAALDAGHLVTLPGISTIADGIATRRAGDLTFEIVRDLVDDVVTVDDEEIIDTVLLLLERCKLLVEGAGAAGLASLLRRKVDLHGMRTIVLLSGGNIDMNMVGRFIQHGLMAQGRYLVIHTLLPDRPGELLRLLSAIADQGVNVLDVEHHRTGPRLAIQQVEVMLTLETRDRAHCERLLEVLRERGYAVAEAQPTFGLDAASRV